MEGNWQMYEISTSLLDACHGVLCTFVTFYVNYYLVLVAVSRLRSCKIHKSTIPSVLQFLASIQSVDCLAGIQIVLGFLQNYCIILLF